MPPIQDIYARAMNAGVPSSLEYAGEIAEIPSATHQMISWGELVGKEARKSNDVYFGTEPTQDERAAHAIVRLSASGLNSLGPWRLPYQALSNGQQARADVARTIDSRLALDDCLANRCKRGACVPLWDCDTLLLHSLLEPRSTNCSMPVSIQ